MRPAALAFGVVLMAFAAYTVRDPRWWARWRESEYRFDRSRIFAEEQERWWGHVFAYICRWSGLVFVVVGFAPRYGATGREGLEPPAIWSLSPPRGSNARPC